MRGSLDAATKQAAGASSVTPSTHGAPDHFALDVRAADGTGIDGVDCMIAPDRMDTVLADLRALVARETRIYADHIEGKTRQTKDAA